MSRFDLGPAILFCPSDRPERYEKALARADAVILDLEDAVAPDAKTAARGALIDSELDSTRVIVRVNPPGTDAFMADLATLSLPALVTATSGLLSPLKSPTASKNGLVPPVANGEPEAGLRPPVPSPSSTETSPPFSLVTARSGLLSPLKSPTEIGRAHV